MADKNCLKCGKQIKSDDKFCPACGHPVGQSLGPVKGKRIDHYIIIGTLLVVALIYVGYLAFSSSSDQTTPHTKFSAQQQPMGMPVDIESFVENLPTEFSSLVSMGNALMDQGQFELAIECYTRALAEKPEDTNVRVDLGTCQHSVGKSEAAIANFKKALEYDPRHLVAKFNLGIVYRALQDDNEAVEWLNKLLEENPSPEMRQQAQQLIREIKKAY